MPERIRSTAQENIMRALTLEEDVRRYSFGAFVKCWTAWIVEKAVFTVLPAILRFCIRWVPILRRPILVGSVITLCMLWFVHQLARYILLGVTTTVVGFGMYTGLIVYTSIGYIAAQWCSTGVIFFFKVFAQSRWIFERRGDSGPLVVAHTTFLALKYGLFGSANSALLYMLVEYGSFNKIGAQGVAIPCLGFFSFLVSRWIFKP